MTVVTQKGYMMLVKVFDDDLAWQVQEQMADVYFTVKAVAEASGFDPLALLEVIENQTKAICMVHGEAQEAKRITTRASVEAEEATVLTSFEVVAPGR